MTGAKDLMIGNLVLFSPSGKVGKVKDRVVSIKTLGEKSCIVNDNGLDLELFYNSSAIKSIPLTDEWLIKLGFQIQRPHVFYESVARLDKFSLIERSGKWFFNRTDYAPIEIKYVHSLMNLFHALTSSELTQHG